MLPRNANRPAAILLTFYGLLILAQSVTSADETNTARAHNRLADETSPYLLLHAHNPVNWYPWGEEALAKAKQEKKLIFLSVGYSSCHWCHVMERESFTDKEIAGFLNEHFVCIKVDREERPDVDTIYMTAVQILARRGGWPMSVFLTPDAKPFFGGTYFPARDGDRPGMSGFLTVVRRVQQLWSEETDKVRTAADRLTELVKIQLDGRRPAAIKPLDAAWLGTVQADLSSQYDGQFGGFGYNEGDSQRPKFPEASNLVFLADRLRRLPPEDEAGKQARKMFLGTLQRMAMGGIRDHLGGGFHRYSVDRFWQIPHFEKMLYDNGQLATVYAEAFRLTGDEQWKRVAEEIIRFVLREMADGEGGFYSALDAESEGQEGKYYRWQLQQIRQLLSAEELQLFSPIYGLDAEPNFEEIYYVPQLGRPLQDAAKDRGLSLSELDERLHPLRDKLLAARGRRVRPLTDTKILTSWNGLMIRGLADAGRMLNEPRHVEAAARAASFVLQKLRTPDGRLLRTYTRGEAKLNGYLNDYAFLVDGLLALHQASGDEHWLEEADRLTALQIQLFWDEEQDGFYFTSSDHESLLARVKNPVDGAQPAGNSVTAGNLLYLARVLDRPAYRERAEKTIQAVSGMLRSNPSMAPRMATAVAELVDQQAALNEPGQ